MNKGGRKIELSSFFMSIAGGLESRYNHDNPQVKEVFMASEYTEKQIQQLMAVRKRRAPKYLAVIDQNGCTGCEVCVVVCPADCIYWAPTVNGVNSVVEINYDLCIGCTLCSEYCPWDTIYRLEFADAMKVAPELTLSKAPSANFTATPAGRSAMGDDESEEKPAAKPAREKVPA
jgi:formate hydrogenlyase subunit 6/NADH:ubiquinone oxidoreductase subunit I